MTPWRTRIGFGLIALIVVIGMGTFGWLSIYRPGHELLQVVDGDVVRGAPQPWQLNFQAPHSPLDRGLYAFHNFLFLINLAICALVLALLLFAVWRFRASAHPTPSKTSHNTALEVTWTILPVLVLLAIAVPSFRLLAEQNRLVDAEMTLKVTGHQWFWEYSYPDNGDFQFSALVLQEDKLSPDEKELRLLMTDQLVVLPVDTTIRIDVTSADVIHAWAVPALGLKKDAVPGRLNEMWVRIDKPGLYFGQCSVLCGQQHSYMPIAIKAVSKDQFAAWAAQAKQKFAQSDDGLKIASATDFGGSKRPER